MGTVLYPSVIALRAEEAGVGGAVGNSDVERALGGAGAVKGLADWADVGSAEGS